MRLEEGLLETNNLDSTNAARVTEAKRRKRVLVEAILVKEMMKMWCSG